MKKKYVFVILINLCFLLQINQVFAQNWVWKTGSNVINQTGTYGTVGVSSTSNSPGARNGSITFTDNSGNLWLFGGRDNSGNLFNDLWKYNISTNQWTWIKGSSAINSLASYGTQGVSSDVNVPGSRCNGVGWVDSNDNFWIFGGEGYTNSLSNSGNLNDLWKYNISTNHWTWIKGTSSTGDLGFFGTIGIANNNNNPSARNVSCGWIYNNKLYLFGGNASTIGLIGDLWAYDINTNQWTWIKGSSTGSELPVYGTQGISNNNNVPGARAGECVWNNNTGELYLFGGSKGSNMFYSDLWKYNISTNQWTWLKGPNTTNVVGSYGTQGVSSSTNNPGARYKSVGNCVVNNNLYLFGGYGYHSSGGPYYMNDLWKLDLTSLQWTFVKGSTGSGQIGNYGTQGIVASTNNPGAREYHSSWNDNNGNFWLFGGWGFANNTTFGLLNDLWVYNNPCSSVSAPTGSTSQTLCSGSTVANLTATGTNIKWYSTSTGGTALSTTTSLVNGTTYYASQTVSGCESTTRLAVAVSVLPVPTVVFTQFGQICSGQLALITAIPSIPGNYIYAWTVPTGVSNPGSVPSFNVEIPGYYDVIITDVNSGCSSIPTGTVIVISTTPEPTGSTSQTLCSGSTVANLTATGINILWYATSTGGTALSTTTALVNGTTYYASQTVNGCESTTRLAVIVALNNPTVSASSTTICGGTNVTLTANSNLTTTQIQTQVNNLVNSGLWNLLVTYNGHYYLKYQSTMTWTQAKVLCEQNGGYMYCVNSQSENDNVSIPIANSQAYGNFFLGLYQDTSDAIYSEPTGGWKWLDGTPLSYANWGQNEPNDNGGSENFSIMDWNNTGALWNDITNVVNGTVIMEYPGITTYLWSTGETSQTISPTPNQTTQYWVDVTSNGVTCRKYITINVNTNIAPSINVTTQSSCATPSGTVQINSPISGGITPQNLFISEVIDATTGALSYVELFNKTGVVVDMSNYKIKVYNNGNTTTTCVSLLSGLIANNSTYIIKLSPDANQNGIIPNFTLASCGAINTNDNIRLTTANDVEIDIWGRTDGIAFTPNNQSGYTYRRHPNAILPSTTWSPVDWDEIDPEDYSDIGTYVFPTNNIYNYSIDGGAYQTSTIFTGLSAGNHIITVKDMTTGCTSSTTFTIQSISIIPTGDISQTFCSGATVNNLVASGTNIKWYLSSSGGTALSSSTLLLNNTSYFATQTINGCESQTRLEVKVTIVDVQINTPNTTVCPGGSTTLTATDLNNLSSTNCLNVSAQLQNGLQAFYPFCGNANDISGNSLNGTVVGATLTSDRFGNLNSAYSFGQNQQINIPNTSGNNTYPLTISLWYNTSTISDGQGQNGRSIFTKYTPASWNGFGIGLFDYSSEGQGIATAPLYLRNTSNRVIGLYNESAFNQSNVHFNTWYHVVFTLDAYGGKMYLNGQLISTHNWTGTAGPSSSSNLWKIGGMWNYWFNGKIDDVAVWNRVLSPIEVQEIYNTPMTTSSSTYLWSTGETTPTISVSPTQTTQYSVAVTTNGVTCTKNITITVGSATPAPTGANNQTMAQGSTLANLVVTGQNIVWYSSPFGGTPLPANTPLVNGVTYYASQTINGCESQYRLPVIVQVTLSNDEFGAIKIVYNPNPVIDILNIKASTDLKNAKICNLLGQTIFQQRFNSNEIQLDMSDVPTGTYFVIVESDDRYETFKILKK